MSKSETLNDKAWSKLFEKYKIIEDINQDGFSRISSKQINEFREARLMTKFDHSINLPFLFKENNLAILPVTRGDYYISKMDAYHKFEKTTSKISYVSVPDYIKSIDFQKITSEATALNVAYVSNMLSDFIGEDLLPTVNGRMSSNEFSFNINEYRTGRSHNIAVKNSQLEIDGGYEGFESLSLIEAKNSLSDDFLVRQLFYPYRLWNNQVDKAIKSIFSIYSNGVFSFYEYQFEDKMNYNSLILVKQKNYALAEKEITLADIKNISINIVQSSEPHKIPFPQADNFSRVVNLCELIYDDEFLTREEITYRYGFDMRQTNYYTDACRYLGLLIKEVKENKEIQYKLSKKGRDIISSSQRERNLGLTKCILEKKIFNEVLKEYFKELEMPSKERIVKLMKQSKLYNINSEATFLRRTSTISSWINWILDLHR